MKKIIKLLAITLTLVMFAQLLPTHAATTTAGLPNAYWALQQAYNEAKAAGDNAKIIAAVQKTYDLFVGSAKPETVADKWLAQKDLELQILTTYLLDAGKAAEAMENYGEMKRFYSLYLIFANRQKMTWTAAQRLDFETFMAKSIAVKMEVYDVDPVFFTELAPNSSIAPYTGAKYEPKEGIIFGLTNRAETNVSKAPSGAFVYVQFKKESVASYDKTLRELAESADVIQLAWNLDHKTIPLSEAVKETKLIEETADYLAGLGVPILLRVAAEMNVWNPPANPAEFKKFFITVADIMRARASNVALVFAPNDISALGANIMDYYPGDKYVDWVGVSNYYQYYFLGNKNASEFDRSIYGTMEYASPVRKIREIVELFGNKKPIMISEYGVANYYNNIKESTEDWASYRLKQIHYYLPMFYPEIKAMFYFNTARNEAQNYALSNSAAMLRLYNKLIDENGIYLSSGQKTPDFVYAKLDSSGRALRADSVIINTYAEVINYPSLVVTYSIQGKQYASVSEIPYRARIDLSGLKDGNYTMDVVIKTASDNRQRATKTLAVQKKGDYVILSDKSISSSRPAATFPPAPPKVPSVGDPIGDVVYTDIKAYINGSQIPMSNIEGYAHIVVEDLQHYGFDVAWDAKAKTLKVERNQDKPIQPLPADNMPAGKKPGDFKAKYVLSEIKVYMSGELVDSYSINGYMFINFELLKKYGAVNWDASARKLSCELE